MCNFYRKTPVLESLFIKKRIQHRCFPANIAKFLRTPIWKNICRRLLLCKLVLLAVYRQDKYSRKQETTKTFTAMKKNIERHQRKIWVIRKFCWSKTLKNWDKLVLHSLSWWFCMHRKRWKHDHLWLGCRYSVIDVLQ